MTRIIITIIAAIAAAAFSGSVCAAGNGMRNVSTSGEFSFVMESARRVLPTYVHKGITYVEGTWGGQYQIRVFNHTGRRVEAVVTVDGRNAVSGQVGDYTSQRGYVIEPWGEVLIEGFRTSMEKVAAFRFTDIGDSYAARMGDATNVGVVGVAIFKERVYRPRPASRPPAIPLYSDTERESKRGRSSAAEKSAPSGGYSAQDGAQPMMEELASSAPKAEADEYVGRNLGTQYGEDTYSPVENTRFVRGSFNRPNALMSARYDNREGLVARGVLPRPMPKYRTAPVPNPFPGSPDPGFAPPPPRYDWE